MVTMYAQLLPRSRAATNADEVEFSNHVVEGIQRVTALIDALLSYSRGLPARADGAIPTDAEAVARKTLLNLAPIVEKRSAVIVIDPLPSVMIEPGALADVFEQLLLNAVEYAREGVPPRVHVGATSDGDEIRFAIRDNGIGIQPEYHARILRLFRRLHGADTPETGVGLPRCRRLIENYGGRLWLESEPGVGSTFYFNLPAN